MLDPLGPSAIREWLTERDETNLKYLWQRADEVRRAHVGDAVHLRGLIEVSNHCVRECLYCGIRGCATDVTRYRMTADEIVTCAGEAAGFGYGTVVLQSGEDPGLTAEFIVEVIRRIKAETGLAITLSLGERSDDELKAWKAAGADRYLLRFETSDPDLYTRIRPSLPGTVSNRVAQLWRMRTMGYEIGSGVMVGVPGQTWDTLVSDIWTFHDHDMDMIGIGPFLPSPRTPLGGGSAHRFAAAAGHQVPNDELTTLKVLALTRLVCPDANLPSTTALATLDPDRGRELGLTRGANIVMPNVTPPQYRVLYEIYPGKAGADETAQVSHASLERRILSIGRQLGTGPGGRSGRS